MAVVETITPPRVRWTRHTINKAMLCPKPTDAVTAYEKSVAAPGEPIGRLLAHIVAHADVIDDGRRLGPDGEMRDHCGSWLLVPMSTYMLDVLTTLGAEQADLEPDPDFEPDHDGEPSLGANEAVSQVACWQRPEHAHTADLEDDEICETNGDDEPSDSEEGSEVLSAGWAPDWSPGAFLPSEEITPST